MTRLEQHPLSAVFPSMSPGEFGELLEDIRRNGQARAIVLFEGKVLDGWHRYEALWELQREPKTAALPKEFEGRPADFVWSMNGLHRHLSGSQRALAKVACQEWKSVGRTCSINHGSTSVIPPTTAQLARDASVSTKTIEHAKTVHVNGSAPLKEAVRDGQISVEKAAAIAKLPPAKQEEAMKAPAPKAKPKPPTPVPDPEALSDEEERKQLLQDLDELRQINTHQERLIDSLRKSDLAKEVDKWHGKFQEVCQRNNQLSATSLEAERHAKYCQKILKDVAKVLGVAANKDIMPALLALKGAQ